MKETAFTHYTRDNTLYNLLLKAAGEDKLPILDNKSFERMNEEYGKEKMRTHLADYIASERPVFPLKEITKDDMRKSFHVLKSFDTTLFVYLKNRLRKKSLRNMMIMNIVMKIWSWFDKWCKYI